MAERHVHVGHLNNTRVFVTIRFEDCRLSLTGVVGPYTNGNCAGSCGQCDDVLIDPNFVPCEGINATLLHMLWNRWHLNDMNAGSPLQMDYLRRFPVAAEWPENHYDKVITALTEAGLQPDPISGYSWGSGWLFETVPQYVIDWLFSLPDSTDSLPSAWRR